MKRVNCGYCFKNFILVNGKCPYCLNDFKEEDSSITCIPKTIKEDYDDKEEIEEVEERSFDEEIEKEE